VLGKTLRTALGALPETRAVPPVVLAKIRVFGNTLGRNLDHVERARFPQLQSGKGCLVPLTPRRTTTPPNHERRRTSCATNRGPRHRPHGATYRLPLRPGTSPSRARRGSAGGSLCLDPSQNPSYAPAMLDLDSFSGQVDREGAVHGAPANCSANSASPTVTSLRLHAEPRVEPSAAQNTPPPIFFFFPPGGGGVLLWSRRNTGSSGTKTAFGGRSRECCCFGREGRMRTFGPGDRTPTLGTGGKFFRRAHWARA